MIIPLWSENNPSVKEILLPTNSTEWDDLSWEEKERMWRYLSRFLFNASPDKQKARFNLIACSYVFHGKDSYENDDLAREVAGSISALNDFYKKQSFARNFLKHSTFDTACEDFHEIFIRQSKDVVFELISLFSNGLVFIEERNVRKKQNESDEIFEERIGGEKWEKFDLFSGQVSEVFEQFGVNYKLTRVGFIAADDPVVVEKIYEPVLKKLSNKKWSEVNRDLADAFKDLRNEEEKDGSGAITHSLSALHGFLQILVHEKTGKGDVAPLIAEAISKKLIPDDDFSKKIINDMNSFFAKERMEKGDPHPKKKYATKNEAKLVISLVMVFVDHVL